MREDKTQVAIVDFLRAVLPPEAFVFSVPNEQKCSPARGAMLNRMGRLTGMADLVIDHEGRAFFLEIKRPRGGSQTTAQKAFQQMVGDRYAVARSIDDARAALKRWGVQTREVSNG